MRIYFILPKMNFYTVIIYDGVKMHFCKTAVPQVPALSEPTDVGPLQGNQLYHESDGKRPLKIPLTAHSFCGHINLHSMRAIYDFRVINDNFKVYIMKISESIRVIWRNMWQLLILFAVFTFGKIFEESPAPGQLTDANISIISNNFVVIRSISRRKFC